MSLALSSLVGAIGRAGLRKEVGLLRPGWTTWSEGASAPNGTVKCRGHGVPEMVTPASRTTAVLLVCKLDKYAMFSFAMTSDLASDSDKFKIIVPLHRVQKLILISLKSSYRCTGCKNLENRELTKIQFFRLTHFCLNYFAILAKIECSICGTVG